MSSEKARLPPDPHTNQMSVGCRDVGRGRKQLRKPCINFRWKGSVKCYGYIDEW